MIFSCDRHRVVNLVDDKRPTEKMPGELPEHIPAGDKPGGKPDHTPLIQRTLLGEVLGLHRRQREKCRSSELILLQKSNHALGCLLVVGDNVLNGTAERRLNCQLIFLRGLDQVRDHAQYPREMILLLHDSANRAAVALIPLRH